MLPILLVFFLLVQPLGYGISRQSSQCFVFSNYCFVMTETNRSGHRHMHTHTAGTFGHTGQTQKHQFFTKVFCAFLLIFSPPPLFLLLLLGFYCFELGFALLWMLLLLMLLLLVVIGPTSKGTTPFGQSFLKPHHASAAETSIVVSL